MVKDWRLCYRFFEQICFLPQTGQLDSGSSKSKIFLRPLNILFLSYQFAYYSIFEFAFRMGNDCLAKTPLEHYQSSFENLKVSELKDYWTTVEVYKIKKIYDGASSKHPEYEKHTHLSYQSFISLFSQLQRFPERQKNRVYEIFNYDGRGYVDWNNFFSTISICYFGPEQILGILMFIIFDESLSKQLSEEELQALCQNNENCIPTKEVDGQQINIYDPHEIVKKLLKGKKFLTFSEWITEYKEFFMMSKFRRIFNIFDEEKIQKELIRHFNENNNLYVEKQGRYISYLVDFKWFQSWRLYVKQYYGVALTNSNKKPMTFKTKKLLRSLTHIQTQSHKKVADQLTLRELKFDECKQQTQDEDIPQYVKNFDFIHSNIGQKPKQITNKVLEGDYQQILRQDIIENRDYVLVSEKVWKTLKKVYQGYPQFRRTGFDFIQLYPKIIRLFPFKNGSIVYSEENVKQVSAYYPVEDIMEAILTKQEAAQKKYFYKAIGMKKWEQIEDLSMALAELSSQITLYITMVEPKQCQNFIKKYRKTPKDITDINLGDQVSFEHPTKKIIQKMVFIGKNVEGKFILHVPFQSYIYNICVMQSELVKRGKLIPSEEASGLEQLKIKRKQQNGLIGIANTKGLGYINSVLLHLYHNWGFKQQLLLANLGEQPNLQLSALSSIQRIFKDMTNKKKIETKIISDMIEQVLPDFIQFSPDLCNQFFNKLFNIASKQLMEKQLKDHLSSYKIKIQKSIKCKKCNNRITELFQTYSLSIPLMEDNEKYYQVTYVPYAQGLSGAQMKKYGFKLPIGATFAQYKQALENVVGLKGQDKKYLIMEVYANNIVKNYSTAKSNASLEELFLRDTDIIVAYQLKLNFSDFVARHYSQYVDFDNKQIKIDQFIDCKNLTRGWIFGKVCDKDYSPYGHRTIVSVIHKFSKEQQWQISYDVDDQNIANFPTKSFLNAEQYHLRLQQRYFNQASNDMQLCNMPLVIVLTSWMRWREFYYLTYLQMRRFINQQLFQDEFLDENQQENQFKIYSSKSLNSKNKKITQKTQLSKFKSFLYGSKFPYKLNFVDYSGRCAICFRFLKAHILPGQFQKYCNGCQLSTSEPISWQIKVADVMVCVDWKKLDYYKKDIVKDHPSLLNLNSEKKNESGTLQNCLNLLRDGYKQNMQQICCHIETQAEIKQKIIQSPSMLNVIYRLQQIYIQRIIQQNGFIKIINKAIKFNDSIEVNGQVYNLIGVTSIDGASNKTTKYRTFIMITPEQWLEYDSNVVRSIKRSYVQKLCALNLFYKRKEIEII